MHLKDINHNAQIEKRIHRTKKISERRRETVVDAVGTKPQTSGNNSQLISIRSRKAFRKWDELPKRQIPVHTFRNI